MALVPKYTTTVGAPGPAGGVTGGGYDEADVAYTQLLGEGATEAKALDQQLRVATLSVEANEREAKFALGVQQALIGASQLTTLDEAGNQVLASPEEQQAYFQQTTNKLYEQYGKLDLARYGRTFSADAQLAGALTNTQTRLTNSLTGELTSGISRLRSLQLQRQMQEIEDRATASLEIAKQLGDRDLYESSLRSLENSGIISNATMESELGKWEKINSLRILTETAYTNPTAIIDGYENVAEMREAFPQLDAKTLKGIRNAAEGEWDDRQQRRGTAWAALREDVIRKGSDINMTSNDFRTQLEQTVGLADSDKIELMRLFRYTKRVYGATGEDPLRSTQDYAALKDAYEAMRNGTITTKEQLHKAWTKDGQYHWSLEKQEQLINRISPDTKDYRYTSDPVIKTLFERFDELYTDEDGELLDDALYSEWGQNRDILEQDIKDAMDAGGVKKYDEAAQALNARTESYRERRAAEHVDGWFDRLVKHFTERRYTGDLTFRPEPGTIQYGYVPESVARSRSAPKGKKVLTVEVARRLLREAGDDEEKAAALAKKRGYVE